MPSADTSSAPVTFVDRHVGPDPPDETQRMLSVIGVSSLDELAHRVIPPAVIADELDSNVLGGSTQPTE